ncbi:MAG TPA: serine/threonine-protein kinase [Gemmatimonadales bacterium]
MERLRTSLAGRYRIDRELGGGGMSRVFLVEELALGRLVVLKVLPPEIAEILSADRFTREVRVAARLQHPHIVPLLASGEAGGLLFYTMPLIEGESLGAKLAREGALPIDEAVRLLRDVADALAGAHAHGVVHRDIKPDNILISQGHAVVTDFGIAKAFTDAGGTDALTATGIVLGTPSYMAPEQASADPHVDHRADLYALGVVAYEMLAGRPPFAGPTAQAVIAAHVTRPARPLSEVRTSVPPPLATLVMRLLEKQPPDRVQSAQEVVRALAAQYTPTEATPVASSVRRWPPAQVIGLYLLATALVLGAAWALRTLVGMPDWFLPSAVALLCIGLPVILVTAVLHNQRVADPRAVPAGLHHALFTWRRALGGGAAALSALVALAGGYLALRAAGVGPVGTLIAKGRLAAREPILVADFVNRTSDSMLGGVVTQALRIDLAQSRSIALVPTDYVRQVLRLMARPPASSLDPELAREVAARGRIKAVLRGEIQEAGAGFMLSAELLSAETGEALVTHREEARDSSEILKAVGGLSKRLRERIGESLRSLEETPRLEQVTTPSLEALRKYSQGIQAEESGRFDQAVRLLEEAVAIDSGFAMAWRKLGTVLLNQRINRDLQISATARAFALRDRLTERERRLTEASYYSIVKAHEDSAIISLERLLDAWPNDSWALNNLGVYRSWAGDYRAAIPYYRQAATAEPLNNLAWGNLVTSLLSVGLLDSARAAALDFRRMLPGHADLPRLDLALVLAGGDFGEGERLVRSYLQTDAADPRAQIRWKHTLAGILQIRGKVAEADRTLEQVEAAWRQAGNRDLAMESLVRRVYLRGRYHPWPETARPLLREGLTRLALPPEYASGIQYWQLAMASARAGDIEGGNGFLALAERQVRESPARGPRMLTAWARAEIAEAAGRGVETALDSLRVALNSPCPDCVHASIAVLFDRLGQRDSAIVHYQMFAKSLDAAWFYGLYRIDRPHVYHRLGELYEWKGDRARALEVYQKFVDLWKEADPELQPRVREARRRIADLAKEPRT